jgi:hypothetical protein
MTPHPLQLVLAVLAASRSSAKRTTVRVAVYTRKSTEEGLDQEFSSLDAQRQSIEASVASQRGEGWLALPDRYDDGGFTERSPLLTTRNASKISATGNKFTQASKGSRRASPRLRRGSSTRRHGKRGTQ